jgi:molecular chaperone DnaK (HSP70)/uncharacterized caspase-like protein
VNAAVIVGCSAYDDPDIADLRYAHADAAQAAFMIETVAGVSSANILTLRDQSQQSSLPTRTNLLRGLTTLGRSLGKPPDTLYFFFSGHGFHSPVDDSDYFLLCDSISSLLEETSISFEFILRILRNTGARHIVLFLDACRAAVSGGRSIESRIQSISVANLSPPGLVSFCSCEPGKLSYESPKIGSGLFTKALCDALGEQGKCTTVREVSYFLDTAMPELSHKLGTPPQLAYTRVEPLQLQELAIASASYRLQWRTAATVGREIRSFGQQPTLIKTPPDPILAIDFGTSSSAAAVTDSDGIIRDVPSLQGAFLTPSTVTFLQNLDYRVGIAPGSSDPDQLTRMLRHVKRYLGSDRVFHVDGRDLTAELVASLIIRSLHKSAEEATGQTIRRCMTAYPANFSIRQANALLRAFQLADVDVVRMVGEPNAASFLLAFERPDQEGTCLVVDLGGGTFDAAVLEFGEGVNEMRSVAGSNELGGVDYDDAIAALAEERLISGHPEIGITNHLRAAIWREAQRAKHFLSSHEEAILIIEDLPESYGVTTIEIPLSRDDFRHATRWLNAEVRRVTLAAIEDAGLDSPIDLVLMTGQGSKIFTIAEALQEAAIGGEWIWRYQELAVVQGLAKYAQVLQGQSGDTLILDLAHRGVGIRCTPVEDEANDQFSADGPRHDPVWAPWADRASGIWKKQAKADTEVHVILKRLTMIPTKHSLMMRFTGGQDELMRLPVIERSKTSDDDVDIGIIEFSAPGQQVELEIAIEEDSGGVIALQVHDWSNSTVFIAQLNQRYRSFYALSSGDYILGILLDGWTIYDQPESTTDDLANEVYRYVGPGRSLSTLAVEPEIAKLREKIARDLSAARDTGHVSYESDAAWHLQVVGRLQAAVGRPQEALISFIDALATFVRLKQLPEAELTYEYARDIVKTLNAEEKDSYLQILAMSLRTAFPDLEQDGAFEIHQYENTLKRIADAQLTVAPEYRAREILAARVRRQKARHRVPNRPESSF